MAKKYHLLLGVQIRRGNRGQMYRIGRGRLLKQTGQSRATSSVHQRQPGEKTLAG